MPAGLEIGAVPEREDPRDACCGPYGSLAEIPAGARIGTSSARRAALLARLRPDLEVVPLRGNVDTRLRKLDAGEADAIVLAAAGLVRLGLLSRIGFLFDPVRVRARGRAGRAGAAGAKWRGGAGVVARPSAVAPARGCRARPGSGAGRRLHGAGGGVLLVRAGRAAGAVVGGAVTVYLVGAGPGDPGLLTVRGRELLGRCDALVYDRLADPRIVALAPASAKRVYAGKEPGRHALSPGSDQRAAGGAGRPAFLRRAAEGRRSVRLRPRRRGGPGAGAGRHRLGGGARHLVGLRRARPTPASRSPSAGSPPSSRSSPATRIPPSRRATWTGPRSRPRRARWCS